MKPSIKLIAAAIAIILPCVAFAQDLKPAADPRGLGFSADRLDRITRSFQAEVDHNQIPGAVVLIARNDKVAYLHAFGFRDRERNLPMTTDAIFRLASMTKPIVTVAAMTLVEEGKLDIAAPVANYLPEFKDLQVGVETKDPVTGKVELKLEPQVRPMTVQDLMRHTSGLVYGPPIGVGPIPIAYREAGVSSRNETLAQMVTKLSKIPLAHQPGEVWEYSMATDVLGRVIEVVSGEDLDHYVEAHVTKPLGMTSTGFYVKDGDKDRVAQTGVDPATGKAPVLFDATEKPKGFSGGSGALSTAGDYLRFAEMLLHKGKLGPTRILAPSTVTLMTSNALKPGIGYATAIPRFLDIGPTPAMGQGFGLGFAVRTEPGQNPLPGSVGSFYWTGAFGTTFYVDPGQNMIVIMMVQLPLGPKGAYYRQMVRALAYQALTPGD